MLYSRTFKITVSMKLKDWKCYVDWPKTGKLNMPEKLFWFL